MRCFTGLMAVGIVVAACNPTEAQTPPPPMISQQPSAPIAAAEARATAAEFARRLEAEYVKPDIARSYATAIRSASEQGKYDNVGTGAALAAMLTRDVQAVAPDGHLRVTEVGAGGPPPPRMVRRMIGGGEAVVTPQEPGPGRAIEVARWLAPGVAYIRLSEFGIEPEVAAGIEKLMKDFAGASTLIFDVRQTPGGASTTVNAAFPFLFGRETALMRYDTRASVAARREGEMPGYRRIVSSTPELLTEEDFVKPHPTAKDLFDAQVFVLTSSNTASAAEHFALALQASGRAKLVGERTAGAGNFAYAGMQAINNRFNTFIPVGRTYDPHGGKGWELVGVEPDVTVTAENALVKALELSGVSAADAQRLSAEVPLPSFRGPPNGARLRQGPPPAG